MAVVEVHQDRDIPEVALEDMEGPADMEVPVEEMQETREVVEEKDTETKAVKTAMVDVADGNRCKT